MLDCLDGASQSREKDKPARLLQGQRPPTSWVVAVEDILRTRFICERDVAWRYG